MQIFTLHAGYGGFVHRQIFFVVGVGEQLCQRGGGIFLVAVDINVLLPLKDDGHGALLGDAENAVIRDGARLLATRSGRLGFGGAETVLYHLGGYLFACVLAGIEGIVDRKAVEQGCGCAGAEWACCGFDPVGILFVDDRDVLGGRIFGFVCLCSVHHGRELPCGKPNQHREAKIGDRGEPFFPYRSFCGARLGGGIGDQHIVDIAEQFKQGFGAFHIGSPFFQISMPSRTSCSRSFSRVRSKVIFTRLSFMPSSCAISGMERTYQ